MNRNLFKKFVALSGLICSLGVGSMVFAEDTEFDILEAEASSILPSSDYGTYTPWNLNDHDLSTAWVENASGNGIGESVTFTLPAGAVVTGVYVVNGYCKSESLFYKNSAPTALTCRVSGKKCNIDLKESAENYNVASKGTTVMFPSPIEAATITFEIKDVRAGNTYTDTCISELHVLGYNFFDVQKEEEAQNRPDPYVIPDLPEDMTENEVYMLESMVNSLYRKYTEEQYIDDIALEAEYASPELNAFLLYWYQYNYSEDSRIQPYKEFHEISRKSMDEMLVELVGSCTDDDFEAFCKDYVVEADGDCYRTYGSGDFGDAGQTIFVEPYAYYQDDRLVLQGKVIVYDSDTNSYLPQTEYTAWFSKEKSNDMRIHTFLGFEVGEQGKEPGAPSMNDSDDLEIKEYSLDELCNKALDYFERHTGYRPSICDAEIYEDKIQLHLYEIVHDHTATADWYNVDATGIGTDVLGNPINLNE